MNAKKIIVYGGLIFAWVFVVGVTSLHAILFVYIASHL